MKKINSHKKIRIIIGGIGNYSGSVPTITKQIIKNKYLLSKNDFIVHYSKRSRGFSNHAKFNITNIFYFIKLSVGAGLLSRKRLMRIQEVQIKIKLV